jgi:ADP-ribose pyrophosphatase YjhB (NUDIX family)
MGRLRPIMIERVRAVLVTPANQILLIRRERPGTAAYWVLPGGHVELTDASREDALRREVREELAGTAEIYSLIHVVAGPADRQHIFLARIDRWSFNDRRGPEFSEPGRGSYDLDLIPANADSIAAVDLKPEAVAQFLVRTLNETTSLFAVPDLRMQGSDEEAS